jgi:hypothetical protein
MRLNQLNRKPLFFFWVVWVRIFIFATLKISVGEVDEWLKSVVC